MKTINFRKRSLREIQAPMEIEVHCLFLWMSSNIEDNSWKWPCSTILSASSITRYLKCSKRQTYSSPWNWTPPADTSRIIHLIERGYTPISPLGIWKRKKTPGIDVYRAVENAYRKNLHNIGNPNSCWKLHRTTDLMRNIPTCTSVCRLFQISKRKWISTTYDTWGTYIGNQIPQSSRGGYYYLRTLV